MDSAVAGGGTTSQQREDIGLYSSDVEAYVQRIAAKIRQRIPFPRDVPETAEVRYRVVLLPSGELLDVDLLQSSGYPAYDEAVRRAIRSAEPLPVPSGPDLFQQVRELVLVFRAGGDAKVAATAPAPAAAAPARTAARTPATTPAKPLTPQQIARNALRSTVVLVMFDATAKPVAIGSGFFIGEREIVTNAHVIQGASAGVARIAGADRFIQLEGIVAVSAERDLAIVRTDEPAGVPLALGDSSRAEVGEAVYALGNPEGLEGTFSQGIVSSVRNVEELGTFLQITAPISHGSSGGPVLDAAGEVIGVAVAILKAGQNLNFAIPSNDVLDLIARTPPGAKTVAFAAQPAAQPPRSTGARRSLSAIRGTQVTWDDDAYESGLFSLSLSNTLDEDVTDVRCLVIFVGEDDEVLDTASIRHDGVVPAGLAVRVDGQVHRSVQRLAKQWRVRVLDYRIAD